MNLLKIDRREARRITGERTYALATKDSNKQDEDRSENRDTLTQGIQRRYMKSREGDGKNLQSSNKKHKYQENNIPKKQTSESSKNKRSTLSDRAAINTIDDDAQKERLTTSVAAAEAHKEATKRYYAENKGAAYPRREEKAPITITNQYRILSEPSSITEDEPEEIETEEKATEQNNKTRNEPPKEKTSRKKKQKAKIKNKAETEIKCQQCKTVYISEQCKTTHEQCAHNNQNPWQDSAQYKCEYREKEHRCSREGNKSTCITLYQYKTKNGKNLYVDSREEKYNDIKSFRLGILNQKNLINEDDILSLGGRRIFCPKCHNCEFATEKCLQIHIEFFHNQQKYENGARPFDHKCYLPERKYIDVIELIDNSGKKTYIDVNKTLYNSLEEYRTHSFKQQPRPKRNKRQLDSTTHSVSELRDFFENQYEDPPQINTEQNILDPDISKLNEKTEESREHFESERHPSEDIYLTELPENTLYITDEIRTQNVIVPDVQQDQNLEDQQIEN